jgi:two-component sensor histidine kinase
VLLKEIHHRVKNNLQIISSLLYLQSRQIEDEPTLDMFIQGQNRVKSMALVHEKLYQSQDLTRIDFAEYIRSLTGYLFQSYDANTRGVHLNIAIDHIFLGVDTAIPCGLIINELVSNALKYAFPSPGEAERELPPGEISIQLQVGADNRLTLTVKDNGIGFPPELDFQNTESLGLQLVNNLVNQLDGTIEFKRNNGTIFRVLFTIPAYQQMD